MERLIKLYRKTRMYLKIKKARFLNPLSYELKILEDLWSIANDDSLSFEDFKKYVDEHKTEPECFEMMNMLGKMANVNKE